jgi:hypothetical protein
MLPKRKRSSSTNEDKDDEDVHVHVMKNNDEADISNNNNDNRFDRIEELLITISREVSDLKNENKTLKESIFEMKNEMNKTIKESIFEMKNEIKGQNDEIKHDISEMKCTMDKEFNPTPLWKLVSDWKDVFEKEVLTKLNGTEQKMFSQTCRASRLAIKRAKIKLDDKFRIYELSSISQLELAWANYKWGGTVKYPNGREFTKNQEEFCSRVAATNDLALLRWVREEKSCAWDWRTSGAAAYIGNLEMLKYCVENGCEVDRGTCATAAQFGNLECLKYLREKNCPWIASTVYYARKNNHIDCLNYALEKKCPEPSAEDLARYAANPFEA